MTFDILPNYAAVIRAAFLKMLAYRARYYTGVITYLLFVSVHYFIWQAVYRADPVRVINGYTLSQMVTYICVGWVARSLYFSDIDYDMDELVRSGQISTYLIRPINFQLMMLAQAFGECLFRAVLFTVPIGAAILWAFPIDRPASFQSMLLFFLATGFSFLILVEINFLVGLLAFSLKSIQGVIRAKYFLVQLCSGLLLPFAFFPLWAQQILALLPFKGITYLPLQFYLGKLDFAAGCRGLAVQLLWTAVLFLLGRFFWMRALARLTLQGG